MSKETIIIDQPYKGYNVINFNVAHYQVDAEELKTLISSQILCGRVSCAELSSVHMGIAIILYNPTIISDEKAQIAIDEIRSYIESSEHT